MNRPRFQFTIRGMLWTTFWAAVCAGVWVLDYKPANHNPPLLVTIIAVGLLSPFIAFGALFGHALRGLLVGIVVVTAYVIFISVAVSMGWVAPD